MTFKCGEVVDLLPGAIPRDEWGFRLDVDTPVWGVVRGSVQTSRRHSCAGITGAFIRMYEVEFRGLPGVDEVTAFIDENEIVAMVNPTLVVDTPQLEERTTAVGRLPTKEDWERANQVDEPVSQGTPERMQELEEEIERPELYNQRLEEVRALQNSILFNLVERKFQSRNEQLEEENGHLEMENERLESEMSVVIDELAQLRSRNERLGEENERLELDNERLEEVREALEEEKERLELKDAEVCEDLAKLHSRNERLDEENTKIVQELMHDKRLEEENERLQLENTKLQKARRLLEKKLEKNETTVDQYARYVDHWGRTTDFECRHEGASWNESGEESTNLEKDESTKLENIRLQLESLEDKVESLEDKVAWESLLSKTRSSHDSGGGY